jgi:hypothetical protein
MKKIAPILAVLCMCTGLYADSRLIFPRVLFQTGRFAGIAIANPTTTDAALTLTAYKSDGSVYGNAATLNIPKGQASAKLASEFFAAPPGPGTSPTYLWLEAASKTDGLTGFFLDFNDTLAYMDGSDLGEGSISLVLPLVEHSGNSKTEISLVNPDKAEASADIEFESADGKRVGTLQSKKLAARAALHGSLSDLFPGINFSTVAGMRIKSDKPLICMGYISRQPENSLVTVAARSSAQFAKTLYFPQLAQGAGWTTSVGIANLSDQEVVVTLTAYSKEGILFTGADAKYNQVTRTIPAGGFFRAGSAEIFGFPSSPLKEGWIKAETTLPALYGYVEYGAGKDRALVSAQVDTLTKAIFSHQAMDDPWFTGLAVLNPSSLSANIEVVSLRPDGTIMGKSQRVLKPGQRDSQLVQQWIGSAKGNGGSVILKSDIPVVATELFGTAPGGQITILANVPPQKITTTFDPAATLPTISIKPPIAVVESGKSLKFLSSGVSGLSWKVNGVVGGDSVNGKVSGDGTYNAPAVIPKQQSITIGASTAAGDQSGGATINLVQKETLVTGLAQVTAVAYFENLQRFFVSELKNLAAPAAEGEAPAATQSAILEQGPPPGNERTTFLTIANDSVSKMLPYVDAKGDNYLLAVGSTSGQIYRINMATKAQTVIANGLVKPTSMALDAKTGNLLVCEESQITVIPRAKFDAALSNYPSAVLATLSTNRKSIPAVQPKGIAVDSCDGSVYATLADGSLIQYSGKNTKVIFDAQVLTEPGEIMLLHIDDVSSCEESVVLLITEKNAVAVVFPAYQTGIEFVSDSNTPIDLEYFPGGSKFAPSEDTLGIAELTAITGVDVGGLYSEEDPMSSDTGEYIEDRFPYQDPEWDTFETEDSYTLGYVVPDILAVEALTLSDSVLLGITFAEAISPAPPVGEDVENSVGGYIDFDTIAGVGDPTHVEDWFAFGDTGLGVDAYVDLFTQSLVIVSTKQSIPIEMAYLDNILVVEIPRSVFDVSRALVTIFVGNPWEPTDIAPNGLYLDMLTADSFKPEAGVASPSSGEQSGISRRLPPPPHRPKAPKRARVAIP